MQYFMYLLKSPCPHPCLCEALQNFHVCAFAYLYAVVCVCLSFRATKNETNEAQKTFQLSPQLTFDCSPGLRLLFLPDPHLLAPHFAPHTLPSPPFLIAADYFAIAAISFHLSGAESLSKRHILRPLEKSNRMGTQQKTITT